MRAWDFPKSLLAWTWRPSRGSSQGRLHQFIHPFIHLFIYSFFHSSTSAGYLPCREDLKWAPGSLFLGVMVSPK